MVTRSTPGYHGVLLEVNLSTGSIVKREIDPTFLRDFTGGRGLGMRLLWEALTQPGVDPWSSDNPLFFMPGPFTGLPLPSAARTCIVTKSPITAPKHSSYPHAFTVAYSNMGGFFAPELRFAGYDGIMVTGRADRPVYVRIDDDRVDVRDARKFWGLGTDRFDQLFPQELGDPRFQFCCIGPAGEHGLPYA